MRALVAVAVIAVVGLAGEPASAERIVASVSNHRVRIT